MSNDQNAGLIGLLPGDSTTQVHTVSQQLSLDARDGFEVVKNGWFLYRDHNMGPIFVGESNKQQMLMVYF